MGGGSALGFGVAGDLMGAVAPGVDIFELADGAVADHFAEAVEVRVGVALGAVLGGEAVAVFEVGFADEAGFVDAFGDGFFAEDVEAAVHGPDGDEGVSVVGGAADDGVEAGVVEAEAPVFVGFGLGKFGFGKGEVLGVDIAEGDDILCFQIVVVLFGAAVCTDEGNVEFVVAEAETGGGEDAGIGSGA